MTPKKPQKPVDFRNQPITIKKKECGCNKKKKK
jgi:hypothetical protein